MTARKPTTAETPTTTSPAVTIGTTLEDRPKVASSREAGPNPYAEAIALLAANRDKSLPVTVPKVEGEDHGKRVASELRKAQAAGAAAQVTVRSKATEGEDSTVLRLWVTDRVSRPRKTSDTPAETAQTDED